MWLNLKRTNNTKTDFPWSVAHDHYYITSLYSGVLSHPSLPIGTQWVQQSKSQKISHMIYPYKIQCMSEVFKSGRNHRRIKNNNGCSHIQIQWNILIYSIVYLSFLVTVGIRLQLFGTWGAKLKNYWCICDDLNQSITYIYTLKHGLGDKKYRLVQIHENVSKILVKSKVVNCIEESFWYIYSTYFILIVSHMLRRIRP